MAEFKIYRKQVGGVRGINDKNIHEAEQDVGSFLNNGWKALDSQLNNYVLYVFLTKD